MDQFEIMDLDGEHVFDLCSQYLAREEGPGTEGDTRHNYFGTLGGGRGRHCDGWRFPIVESHFGGDPQENLTRNEVTFVYLAPENVIHPFRVQARGSFARLYRRLELRRVEDSRYFAACLLLPAGRRFKYRFIVNGQELLDPINPQLTTEDDGQVWSQFFTLGCFEPITFERWERVLLERLTRHILPFNTRDAEVFFRHFSVQQRASHPYLHRFDQSVGAVNFMDKLLAREERHHLGGYKTCLAMINAILRQRNPYQEPRDMPESMFVELYNQMWHDVVPGWEYERYRSPLHFLQMLRRHAYSGAFCHPKYGGNAGAAGWAYLSERYRDEQGRTLFDWRAALEQPLGVNEDYFG